MYTAFIAAFTLALVGLAAQAKSLGTPTNIGANFPVHNLPAGSTSAPNVTLGHGASSNGPHANVVAADFPAFLLICETTECISCFSLDMSVIPHNSCINPGVDMLSMAINQPSNTGLHFGVFTGPAGCKSFAQIPAVNTCYNLSPAPFSDYSLA